MAFEPFNRGGYRRTPGSLPPLPGTGGELAVADSSPAVRAAFLNKVYLTLCGGVAVAMAAGFFVATSAPGLLSLFLGKGVLGFVVVLVAFVGLAMAVQAVARIPGVNVLVYGLFTAVTGAVILAPLFAVGIAKTGGYDVIWNAFGLSALVFGGLTGFVLITGKDFSFLRGALTMGLLVLIAFMIGGFFLQSSAYQLAITCGGLLLFGLFVLYDTSNIMRSYSSDMWIAGALSLFLDFINIFIRILYLFLGRSDD